MRNYNTEVKTEVADNINQLLNHVVEIQRCGYVLHNVSKIANGYAVHYSKEQSHE